MKHLTKNKTKALSITMSTFILISVVILPSAVFFGSAPGILVGITLFILANPLQIYTQQLIIKDMISSFIPDSEVTIRNIRTGKGSIHIVYRYMDLDFSTFGGFTDGKGIFIEDSVKGDVVEGLIAHESGHIAHDHVVKRKVVMVLMSFVYNILLGIYALSLSGGWVSLALFIVVALTGSVLIGLIQNAYFRFTEKQADDYAVKENKGQCIADWLDKMSDTINGSTKIPAIFHQHPPIVARIASLRK